MKIVLILMILFILIRCAYTYLFNNVDDIINDDNVNIIEIINDITIVICGIITMPFIMVIGGAFALANYVTKNG